MNKRYQLISILFLATLMGCQTNKQFAQNEAGGREIVIQVNVFSQDAAAKFPQSLNELVAAGLLKAVPRCTCSDGTLRDFVYVPGFETGDGTDWVILTTPPEMDRKLAIIFYIDTHREVVTRERALREIERSRAFLKARDTGTIEEQLKVGNRK